MDAILDIPARPLLLFQFGGDWPNIIFLQYPKTVCFLHARRSPAARKKKTHVTVLGAKILKRTFTYSILRKRLTKDGEESWPCVSRHL
jgi:hypothetical protein